MNTLLLILFSATAAFGQGTILWDESVNGPLSHFSSSATALASLQVGTNTIIGTVEIEPNGGIWITYEDFFTLNFPLNLAGDAVVFQLNKPDVQTWIGDTSFNNHLGLQPNSMSGELLPQWGIGPLLSGQYGMYIANHDAQSFTSIAIYRLDFFVQAIPEPSAFSLLNILPDMAFYTFMIDQCFKLRDRQNLETLFSAFA